MSLTTESAVSTLDDLGLLDLEKSGPWRGEPDVDEDVVHEIDWTAVDSREEVPTEQFDFDSVDATARGGWGALDEELRRVASRGQRVPPPDVLDALGHR